MIQSKRRFATAAMPLRPSTSTELAASPAVLPPFRHSPCSTPPDENDILNGGTGTYLPTMFVATQVADGYVPDRRSHNGVAAWRPAGIHRTFTHSRTSMIHFLFSLSCYNSRRLLKRKPYRVRNSVKLPNGERAVVDIDKLKNYCLNPEHRRGCHKARVFAASLGMTIDNAGELRSALLAAARNGDATPAEHDEYGARYVVDFITSGPGGQARIRSSWIIRRGEDFPRLTSCYVL